MLKVGNKEICICGTGLELLTDLSSISNSLTGMYMAKPIENIIYEVTNRIESKIYELEGENEE